MAMLRDTNREKITPPGSFNQAPLTPPPTDPKPYKPVPIIIEHLRSSANGRDFPESPWLEFKLQREEYEELLQREEYEELLQRLRSEEALWSFVVDKIR